MMIRSQQFLSPLDGLQFALICLDWHQAKQGFSVERSALHPCCTTLPYFSLTGIKLQGFSVQHSAARFPLTGMSHGTFRENRPDVPTHSTGN